MSDGASALGSSIIKALLYSDIFDYPLTSAEIFRRLETNHVNLQDVEGELSALASIKLVFKFGRFYSIRDDIRLAEKRLSGNRKALEVMPKAVRRARLISRFPFVRGVFISGSLSKEYSDERSDVDYFIVTEPGKLWFSRTLLVLFKRIFLLNSHKYFCVNYFVDHQHLEIEEKNIFTATELATLIPVSGIEYYHKLMDQNTWLTAFFPNLVRHEGIGVSRHERGFFKKIMEKILSRPAERLDGFLLKISLDRWRKLHGSRLSGEEFQIAFKSKKHVSKGHMNNYQFRVTEQYRKKIESFFAQHPQP